MLFGFGHHEVGLGKRRWRAHTARKLDCRKRCTQVVDPAILESFKLSTQLYDNTWILGYAAEDARSLIARAHSLGASLVLVGSLSPHRVVAVVSTHLHREKWGFVTSDKPYNSAMSSGAYLRLAEDTPPPLARARALVHSLARSFSHNLSRA